MTDPAHPDREYGQDAAGSQERLPLVRGVQTIVWHLPHGTILIETDAAGVTHVNGSRVEPLADTLARMHGKEATK